MGQHSPGDLRESRLARLVHRFERGAEVRRAIASLSFSSIAAVCEMWPIAIVDRPRHHRDAVVAAVPGGYLRREHLDDVALAL